MFAMLRRSLLGLFIASVIGIVLCAVFLFASFTGISVPCSAWAQGWLPVQVSSEAPGTPRRKVTRFSSLERAVAKAGSGDTVTILSSIEVSEPVSVDKDLSIVINQGCDVHSTVGEGRPVFAIEPACRDFSLVGKHASRFVFDSCASSGLLHVLSASVSANVAVRGVGVHDAVFPANAALIDIAARPASLFLEGIDVFNLRAPVVRARSGACSRIVIADSRLERIKGDVAVDLVDSPVSTLLVTSSVLIGSLGCDLIHMTRPNLLLCDNSYLSALGARAVVVDDFAASPATGGHSAFLNLGST